MFCSFCRYIFFWIGSSFFRWHLTTSTKAILCARSPFAWKISSGVKQRWVQMKFCVRAKKDKYWIFVFAFDATERSSSQITFVYKYDEKREKLVKPKFLYGCVIFINCITNTHKMFYLTFTTSNEKSARTRFKKHTIHSHKRLALIKLAERERDRYYKNKYRRTIRYTHKRRNYYNICVLLCVHNRKKRVRRKNSLNGWHVIYAFRRR